MLEINQHPCKIVQLAVPTPLRRKFDYLIPESLYTRSILPGMRVLVPFGRTTKIAIVLGCTDKTDIEFKKLRCISKVLDNQPILPEDIMILLNWVSHYYHHPIGEVFQTALPVQYRKKETPLSTHETVWILTEQGRCVNQDDFKQAVRQRDLWLQLNASPEGLNKIQLAQKQQGQWPQALKKMLEKNWVTKQEKLIQQAVNDIPKNQLIDSTLCKNPGLTLNAEQAITIKALTEAEQGFQAYLLDGITGSGKTEVYLAFIQQQLEKSCQVLVLVPEIGLTPQLIERFKYRFNVNIASLHSGLNNTQRFSIWQQVAAGEVRILIGTRSAIFTPMPDLGAIIIDEEHDLSFKQQDGIRYSAKDIALMRASNANIPIILGTATPSMESLYLCQQGKMKQYKLRKRAGNAKPPEVHLIDIRGHSLQHGLSRSLIDLMKQHLDKKNQVLLFQNRRGYSPVLLCNKCGWISHCHRCDAKLTYHHQHQHLRCHHCQNEYPLPRQCPECAHTELSYLGIGTERVEKTVRDLFPQTQVVRIDRDTTSRKGSLTEKLELVKNGQEQILIGTQMLAKGHHFPNVTLVAILDIDQGLYSIDFRAPERLSQLIVQVSGRAGRAEKKGQVILQTAHPEDETLNTLLNDGYAGFAKKALAERKELLLPPYAHQALIRVEANKIDYYQAFLSLCFSIMNNKKQYSALEQEIQFLGPVPAPMEKKAGKFRGQLLIQSLQRKNLHSVLNDLIYNLDTQKQTQKNVQTIIQRVRWSIDIDPQDLY